MTPPVEGAGHIARLGADFGRGEAVRFRDSPLGGIVAELAVMGARAQVALQGAQVLSYVPAGERDLLWVSPMARLGTGKAVRGGIPVCWPWFGPHPSDGMEPAHGFVRVVPWTVVGSGADENSAHIVLACPYPVERRGEWSAQAELTLAVRLGDKLIVTLSTRNLGDEALAITEALHTYLAIGDIDAVAVTGLDGQDYIDKLDGNAVKGQEGQVCFAGEVDRIYADPGPACAVADRSRGRRIVLGKDGSASTVVWNPWIAKSERLGDMGPEGYRRMVCVETANCGDVLVSVPPGGTHEMSLTLSVERL